MSNVKTLVRGAFDIQKLRIQMGNRVVGNWKVKLGQKPTKSEDEMDVKGKQILTDLRSSFKNLTDVLAQPKNNTRELPTFKKFEGDEVISNYTELCLIRSYIALEKEEKIHFDYLKQILEGFPVYTEFLKGVNGVGHVIAGVIISEIDISKAKYPSSLWKYAGLDVVSNKFWKFNRIVEIKNPYNLKIDYPETNPLDHFGQTLKTKIDILDYGERELHLFYKKDHCQASIIYSEAVEEGKEGGEGRSRKKHHLVQSEYEDKEGEIKTKMGISFNPFLKTKLIGVLAASFLKVSESPYKDEYYNYKTRLENNPKHQDKTKGHRHNMALRRIVKLFLVDLHIAWRGLEGLPVSSSYAEGKLKLEHTG